MAKKPRLTAERLRLDLAELGLTQQAFAARADVNERTVRRWVLDECPIPRWVGAFISVIRDPSVGKSARRRIRKTTEKNS